MNAVAKRDFRATCGHVVPKGARCSKWRERALSYAHASAAGSMYPVSTRCEACVVRSVAIGFARKMCGYMGAL